MRTARRSSSWAPRVIRGDSGEPVSDADILAAFERGDAAFGPLLYDRLISIIEGTLKRMLGRGERDLDDLIQATFEQIVSTLARRRYAGACSLRSWAAAVTCNVALNALRSRKTERRYFNRSADNLTEPSTDLHPERATAARAEIDRVRMELAAMSPKLAETLVLHDAFGHELSEIAVLTGTSLAAAQARLLRGRKELRRRLEGGKEAIHD